MYSFSKYSADRADRLEDYWRDFAFLGLNEELSFQSTTCLVCGGRGFSDQEESHKKCAHCEGRGKIRHRVEVRLLTLRMFMELCAVRSPFLVRGRLGPEHIAQILWRLSPEYENRESRIENRKAEADSPRMRGNDSRITVRQQFVGKIAALPFHSAVRSISRYLDRMLIDKPPEQTKKNSKAKPDTSFAAAMIHRLAEQYGWSGEEILDLPIPRLFQYLSEIRRANEIEVSFWNPIRDRFIQRYMARRKLWKESQTNGDAC